MNRQQAVCTGQRVYYDERTETIRESPSGHTLAIRGPDGYWYAYPDEYSPLDANSLTLVMQQYEGDDLDDFAMFIESAFYGMIEA